MCALSSSRYLRIKRIAFLKRVFGIIDALIREDNGMFKGGVFKSEGVLNFINNEGVFRGITF